MIDEGLDSWGGSGTGPAWRPALRAGKPRSGVSPVFARHRYKPSGGGGDRRAGRCCQAEFDDRQSLLRNALKAISDAVGGEHVHRGLVAGSPSESLVHPRKTAHRPIRIWGSERPRFAGGRFATRPTSFRPLSISSRFGRREVGRGAGRSAGAPDAFRLRCPCDPTVFAEQFLTLVTGPVQCRLQSGRVVSRPPRCSISP